LLGRPEENHDELEKYSRSYGRDVNPEYFSNVKLEHYHPIATFRGVSCRSRSYGSQKVGTTKVI
jgi:hypothetical protein